MFRRAALCTAFSASIARVKCLPSHVCHAPRTLPGTLLSICLSRGFPLFARQRGGGGAPFLAAADSLLLAYAHSSRRPRQPHLQRLAVAAGRAAADFRRHRRPPVVERTGRSDAAAHG